MSSALGISEKLIFISTAKGYIVVFHHCLLLFLHIQLFTELTFFSALLRKLAHYMSISLLLQVSDSHPWSHWVLHADLVREKT